MAQSRTAPSLPGPIDPQLPQDYLRARVEAFDGGMDTSVEPERLPSNKLTFVQNLFWYDGELLVDTGYAPFGPGALLGQPHVVYQAFFEDGTAALYLLTTQTLYFLSSGSPPQWQFVGYGGGATLTSAAAVSTATTLVVTNPSIFFNGASVTYLLTNDTPQNATVTAPPSGSTITISPAVPAAGVNANAWVAVNLTQPTITSALASGATTVPVSSTAGIVVGTHLGVLLTDGSQWQFTVGVIASLNITPSGGATCPVQGANSGAAVTIAPAYNGRVSTQPVFSAFSDGSIIFSNGVDPIQRIVESVGVKQLAGLPDGTTCAAMNVSHGQLLLGQLIENGTEFPQRVRASDQADPLGWVPGQNGIAAIYNLQDTEDFILSINLLGPWVIVYRETTIMRGSYLGLPLQTWYWEYMVFGEGIQSQQSVSELGESHFLVGTQGCYLYSGGYELNSIGDPIFAQLLSAKGNLNAAAKSTIFTQYVSDQDEVWVFYPTGSNLVPDTMLRCSLEKTAWYVRNFANTFLSAGFFLPLQTIEWVNAVGTWAQNTAAWNSRVFLQNAANIILCANNVSQTFVYDYNTPGDNGVPVSWSMQLRDIGDGDALMRWDTLVLYGEGNNINVGYTLDPANEPFPPQTPVVFTNLGTVNFGNGRSRQRLTLSNVSTWIRLQFSGADPTFTLSYAELWYSFESEW